MSNQSRRAATPEEAKALANPLRLRILRLCLDQALTNKQLAEHLGKDPGTILHHVRTLVATGFLAPERVRQGERGAFEKPYRATGKSWTVDVTEVGEGQWGPLAAQSVLEAFRAEVQEAGPDAMVSWSRLGLTLDDASLQELRDRLQAVAEDFAARPPDPEGRPYGLYLAIHSRRRVDSAGP
ncbi:MAG TPA: winged helix-turn-helix domain-containing protein [Actinomycetes bacterium]|jgi:DNA-binding transcriptional ArsR family regulator|nr:winged helix-turn-helix domain-containing protein [Actinomycetes bacterium]